MIFTKFSNSERQINEIVTTGGSVSVEHSQINQLTNIEHLDEFTLQGSINNSTIENLNINEPGELCILRLYTNKQLSVS